MKKLIAWFVTLSSRDQWVLLGGVGFGLLALGYGLLWSPLQNKIETLEKSVADNRELYTWMQKSVEEVKRLQASEQMQEVKARGDQSLLGLIDSTARGDQLGNAVKRIQPTHDGGAQVWLANSNFSHLLTWLTHLEEYGVIVDVVKIKSLNQPGFVNVELTLKEK
ncbi:MAG: type II secretion system protein M [Gammaproteobacteria bacterium]|nr:type II secretion system protein M [Gammaproteobacteria bacterium]